MDNFDIKWEQAKSVIYGAYKKHDGKIILAYSGGKDSSVLLEMIRQVNKENKIKIKVVSSDTGIEFPSISKRMYDNADIVVKPEMSYGQCIIKYGKPLLNKGKDEFLKHIYLHRKEYLDTGGLSGQWYKTQYKKYLNTANKRGKLKNGYYPRKKYIDLVASGLKISSICCEKIKKKPMREWQNDKKNKIECVILGFRLAEKGVRTSLIKKVCYFKNNNGKGLAPLREFTDSDMKMAIDKFGIDIDPVYDLLEKYAPKSQRRTGCFLCPYGKFRHYKNGKVRSWYLDLLIEYDKINNTNLYGAFININRQRLELDNIKICERKI